MFLIVLLSLLACQMHIRRSAALFTLAHTAAEQTPFPNVIIIISLFQEDNIFGTNNSLTYGPQLQR